MSAWKRDETPLWRPSYGIVFSFPLTQRASSPLTPSVTVENEGKTANTATALELTETRPDAFVPIVASVPARLEGGCLTLASRSVVAAKAVQLKGHDLPLSDRTFMMTESLFRAAKDADTGSPQSFWSHSLYRGPLVDGKLARVKIHYCRSKHTTERTLQYFVNHKVLGFDIEWKPETTKYQGVKQNVSLIQLASEDRIALFHVALFPKSENSDLVAPTLKSIMEDAAITKVGVAIKADCTRLRKYLNIQSRGTFELSHLHKLVTFSGTGDFKQINKKLVSLSTQVQEHLHLPLFKGEVVRGSDWSQPLNMDQIAYAAADSYAALHLFHTLDLKRKLLDPIPPRPYHAEENKAIRFVTSVEHAADEIVLPSKLNDRQTSTSNIAGSKELSDRTSPTLSYSLNSSTIISESTMD